MRLPGHKLLLAAGVVGVVVIVGLVAAITDNLGLALICVLLVQAAALLAVVDTRRRQVGLSDQVKTDLKRIDRTIANVSQRVVTEASATDNVIRTELTALRAELRTQGDAERPWD